MKVLFPAIVTVGKLIPVVVFVPGVLRPVRAILRPFIETDPDDPPLVKLKAARLVLFAAEEAVCEKRPFAKVRLPAVIVSLPAVSVRFLPVAIVVSPLSEIAPVPVLKVPLPAIEKLPDV